MVVGTYLSPNEFHWTSIFLHRMFDQELSTVNAIFWRGGKWVLRGKAISDTDDRTVAGVGVFLEQDIRTQMRHENPAAAVDMHHDTGGPSLRSRINESAWNLTIWVARRQRDGLRLLEQLRWRKYGFAIETHLAIGRGSNLCLS